MSINLFCVEEKTDYYVGRKGAFKELIKATELLLRNKIAPRWQIFINRDNMDDLQPLIKLSKEMNLGELCKSIGEEFELVVHQGSCEGENEKLYDIRITSDDLVNIPEEFHHRLGETEEKIYQELLTDASTINIVSSSPVFYITPDFDVYPNYSSIAPWGYLGNIKEDGIERVLNNYINNRSLAQYNRLTVPINKMVKAYGNPNSKRLFDKGDYIIYIINQYCKIN